MAAASPLIRREEPALLRRDLRGKQAPELLLRRMIVGMSFIGTACMAATTLFQMGMVKHLKDRRSRTSTRTR